MPMRLLVALSLLLASVAQAAPTVTIGMGKGAFSSEHGIPFERALAMGYEHDIAPGVFVRPEAGYFVDLGGAGRSSSPWVAPLVGVKSHAATGLQLHVAMGPGYLVATDSQLGGHFQFSLEGGAGIADARWFIGVVWKHLSSAGLASPNRGRDFVMVQVKALAF